MPSSTPRLSVVVPNYNHARFLRERLDSILAQNRSDIELIVLDDASDDQSRRVIEDFQDRHPGCISAVLANEVNSGSPFSQWNKGVAAAKGELVWIAESDDVAEASLLDRLLPHFSDPTVVMAYCRSRVVDESGNGQRLSPPLRSDGDDRFSHDFVEPGVDFLSEGQLAYNLVSNASAVVFRRQAYLECGGADPSVQKCADWLVWSKLMLIGKVGFVSSPLNRFRRHSGSVIANAGGRVALMHYDLGFHAAFAHHLTQMVRAGLAPSQIDAVIENNERETLRLKQRIIFALARSRQWRDAIKLNRELLSCIPGLHAKLRHQLRFGVACARGWLRGR